MDFTLPVAPVADHSEDCPQVEPMQPLSNIVVSQPANRVLFISTFSRGQAKPGLAGVHLAFPRSSVVPVTKKSV
jgi:hypothetical protein